MKITKKKNNRIYVHLKDFPTDAELEQLNGFNLGNYYLCEYRGYKRLMSYTGEGHEYICMECPINETFQL